LAGLKPGLKQDPNDISAATGCGGDVIADLFGRPAFGVFGAPCPATPHRAAEKTRATGSL